MTIDTPTETPLRSTTGATLLLSGNEAVAQGAVEARALVTVGYRGTPSTEILESISERTDIEVLRHAVQARVPAKHKEMNLNALEAGMDLVGTVAS